ncbi:MAG: ribosomal protein [Modestobacter sp.]|nr:ribosomal protein [Modestobacter sp.]
MSVSTDDSVDTAAPEHKRATVRPDKADTVAELVESFRGSSAAVLTEYRGLTVKQISALRVALGADTSYAVVKNTLTQIAARDAGLEGVDALLTGPTAVAFITGEPVEAAKALRDFARANPALVVKGGVMDGKALSADDVRKLADLESREVLLGKMAGALLASLSNAVYLFNAPLAQAARLVGALEAKATEDPSVLAGGAGTPAAAPADETAELADEPVAGTAGGAETVPAVVPGDAVEAVEPPAVELDTTAGDAVAGTAAGAETAPAATASEGVTPAETDSDTPA